MTAAEAEEGKLDVHRRHSSARNYRTPSDSQNIAAAKAADGYDGEREGNQQSDWSPPTDQLRNAKGQFQFQ
ncbi:hypothetical protein niasHT_034629 [Heterodera trifolii]|uniref:Uncharacterized protein n=1 Tax=Heterodera trifolii TaxID=157864 RepID=A0ABD2ILM5_9BILA